jgi:hypothetical protein
VSKPTVLNVLKPSVSNVIFGGFERLLTGVF